MDLVTFGVGFCLKSGTRARDGAQDLRVRDCLNLGNNENESESFGVGFCLNVGLRAIVVDWDSVTACALIASPMNAHVSVVPVQLMLTEREDCVLDTT